MMIEKSNQRIRRCTYFCLLLCLVLSVGCSPRNQGGIAAGTAHVAEILRGLSGDQIQVYSMIPGAMCPGHFDLRPGNIERIASADLVLIQPWQENTDNIGKVIKNLSLPENRVQVVDVPGNWMLPDARIEAVKKIAQLLSERFPEEEEATRTREAAMIKQITDVSSEMRGRLKDVSGRVICSNMQESFLQWAGITITAAYGRTEGIGTAELDRLISTVKENHVDLIIDNLQSGDVKTGAMIARECNTAHLVLSNFPEGFEDTETWEKAFRRNCDLLMAALGRKEAADG